MTSPLSTAALFVSAIAGVKKVVVTLHRVEYPRLQPTAERILAECETLEAFAAADPYRQAGAPAA